MVNGGIMNKKITFVKGDDWEGLYINGKLIKEDHSLHVEDVLEAVGVKVDTLHADCEWLWDQGSLPDKLDEVVFYE